MTRTKLAAPPPGSQSKRGPPPGMGLALKSLELTEPAQQSRRDGLGLDLSGMGESADTGEMAGEMEWLGAAAPLTPTPTPIITPTLTPIITPTLNPNP